MASPSQEPLHTASFPAIAAVTGVGSVITVDEVAIQPTASVTDTVIVPSQSPVAVAFVSFPGAAQL